MRREARWVCTHAVLGLFLGPAGGDAAAERGTGSARVGCLLKERVGRVGEFLDALHRVAGGGTAVDPEVVARLLTRTRSDARLERLSPRGNGRCWR